MAYGVGTTHHIKLGDYHYLTRPGTYRKRPAPMFGSRFTSGDPSYNTLNAWQYWAQTCWVGGHGAETWRDDAMFDEGVGVDTTQHEVMMLSRDLTRSASDMNTRPHTRRFIVYNKILYCLEMGGRNEDTGTTDPSRLFKWAGDGTVNWSWVKTFAYQVRSLEVFMGKLFVGDGGGTMTYMSTDETWTNFNKPSGVGTNAVYAMKVFRDHMYVGFRNKVWRLNKDFVAEGADAWDGSTVFYEAPSEGYIRTMEVHLGFLYIGATSGEIFRCDGNNTHEMWKFESGNQLLSMRSFDGRLFLSVAETLLATNARQAVLYQFSGAAVTELKRWGEDGRDIIAGELRVFGGRLWYGASSLLGMGDGFGIATYDAREDAHYIFATNKDYVTYANTATAYTDWRVDDVFYYKGHMFASVRGFGVFQTKYSYKDARRELATYDTTVVGIPSKLGNGGYYTSSDFDGGTPGLLKLWNAVRVHVDLPASTTSIELEISTDGGLTWRDAGTLTGDGTKTRYSHEFFLEDENGDELRASRLKYRIQLLSTNQTRSPFLRGVIVRYLPIPEPNWVWDMTLVLSERQELLDGSIVNVGFDDEPTISTKLADLRSLFRQQELVQFTEPDGTKWASGTDRPGVLILVMEELLPHIGPSSAGPLEYEVRISLMEMVDQYET